MKKTVFAIAASIALAMGMTACDPSETLLGNVQLYATDATGDQAYADGDSISFNTAISNINIDTLNVVADSMGIDTTLYNIDAGMVIVGNTGSLGISSSNVDVTFPIFGINLRGNEAKTYSISCPVEDFSFMDYLHDANITSLISSGMKLGDEETNLFLIAVDEESFYIGYEGSVKITKVGGNGGTINGDVKNVKCIYLTINDLKALYEMSEAERANYDLLNHFSKITFNGSISSRRLPLDAVLSQLEDK